MAEGGVESQPTVLPEEPAERVRVMLERILEELGLEASVAVEEGDEEIHADIEGEEVGLLIGRHGQTIDAVQHLAAAAALPGTDGEWEIVVDTAGYRVRRERRLRALALKAAARAVREARAQALEPMSSAERRIVHTVLVEYDGVETASEGRDPARYVVVRPSEQG
jgi:spoIIIJ-associated protein